jgi:hypothetical protein
MPRATAEQVNNYCINMADEEWRDIPGYEDIYQVSSLGRVKHLSTTILEVSSSGEVVSSRSTREYILKQCQNNQNYLHVGLVKSNKTNSIGVHRLVALAFVPKLPDQNEVHHIDKNRQNNDVSNLQWVSFEEHYMFHRVRMKHLT